MEFFLLGICANPVIPTIDNFCVIAHVKNVDTSNNQRLQNYIDKEEKISSFCPLSLFFKNGVYIYIYIYIYRVLSWNPSYIYTYM